MINKNYCCKGTRKQLIMEKVEYCYKYKDRNHNDEKKNFYCLAVNLFGLIVMK